MATFVAPLAGAWIEMLNVARRFDELTVAPLAGAWIEIPETDTAPAALRHVAPLAGAWIEICPWQHWDYHESASLPSRERGLKSILPITVTSDSMSLPSRERGLKYGDGRKGGWVYKGRSPRGSVD